MNWELIGGPQRKPATFMWAYLEYIQTDVGKPILNVGLYSLGRGYWSRQNGECTQY